MLLRNAGKYLSPSLQAATVQIFRRLLSYQKRLIFITVALHVKRASNLNQCVNGNRPQQAKV